MAEWNDISLTCPICQDQFGTRICNQLQANGQDTDGRLHFVDEDPLGSFVHTCPSCHFTAARSAFQVHLPDREIFRVKSLIETQPAPTTTAERYALLAHILETFRRDEPLRAGNAWLTASWAARLGGERRAEREHCRRAIRWFDEELRLKLAPREERAYLAYLIGELHRRLGEFDDAVRYFDAVVTLADTERPQEHFLIRMAIQQKNYAREHCHVNTMVPAKFLNRGMFLRHFRQRLDEGETRDEVSPV